ncbi:dimethylsulfonioproprionate lyase family protein [Lichenifustis flavocetrariae]|uniref:Dimethylsulfoniopropionate lyase n=1 Tax=Lichenifustis flavocetrariae TaxID=2949735 RepID=A0AA41Z1V7_9HYPH|nr:dimethylsulfonioproprionate lyase family protein [Lichenifustis flavocetrariae]MCW6512674.1 dimethylsulfoniopropionate lyase [Lichenifustis flavocetrariae]
MTPRAPALQTFLSSVHDALAASDLDRAGSDAIGRIYAALETPGSPGSGKAQRLAAVDSSLPDALAAARRHSTAMAGIAYAFQALEPSLYWAPRSASGPHASANWLEGHANAMIVGPGGVESRNDMQIGVSLMAPHVRYPDHTHAPEEVYLVLSPGRFQHGESGWFEPGIGGTLYNEPSIRHAMASDASPLFAIWLLWVERPVRRP